MRPTTQFHEHQNGKRNINIGNGMRSSPLKINKDSHFIKKSASPPSSSSSSSSISSLATVAATKPQQYHPVIIYTHSPKIIHTHPRDFMALVQKLTGLSRSESDVVDPPPPPPKQEEEIYKNRRHHHHNINNRVVVAAGTTNDDNESLSSSVVTEGNCSSAASIVENYYNVQINSCFATPPPPLPSPNTMIFDPQNPNCFNNIPFFTPSSSDFFCPPPPHPFYSNYADSLLLRPNMRSSYSSSNNTLEGMKEFGEF